MCGEFGLTISLRKTTIMGQDVSKTPSISIGDFTLEVVEGFTYLGSTISSNLSLEVELYKWIGKASTAMAHLAMRVWDNPILTINTKIQVHQACVLSTLPYGSKSWTFFPAKNRGSTPFTCIPSDKFWVSRSKIVYQTRMSSTRQACPTCLHS